MRDGTRHLDAEQARHTEQEAKHACNDTAPDEHRAVPFPPAHELEQRAILSLDKNEWGQEQRRAEVLPVCELDGRIMRMRQGGLDQDCVYGNE